MLGPTTLETKRGKNGKILVSQKRRKGWHLSQKRNKRSEAYPLACLTLLFLPTNTHASFFLIKDNILMSSKTSRKKNHSLSKGNSFIPITSATPRWKGGERRK